jgi:hypothetical protein
VDTLHKGDDEDDDDDDNMKSVNNPSSGSRVVPCGRKDIMQLVVAFLNFAKAPDNTVGCTKQTHRY